MQMDTNKDDTDQFIFISQLVRKLGHELEEIRLRSLETLVSKLEHNFIKESDLVQHKTLFVKLFEWFNFTNAPQKEKVLNLILTLCDQQSAVKNIQNINGLQFLTELKRDLNESLRSKVDEICERLMNGSQKERDNAELIIQQRQASLINSSRSLSSFTEKSRGESQPRNAQSYSLHSNSIKIDERSVQEYMTTSQSTFNSQIEQVFSQTLHSIDINSQLKLAMNDSLSNETLSNTYSLFYWIPLTTFDKTFLTNTLNSLKSNDAKTIKNFCFFLKNIVFNDFPVEIFLQRPSILKCLLELLSAAVDNELFSSLISCVNYYCIKLNKRLEYLKNPSTFCIKDFHGGNFDTLYTNQSTTRTHDSQMPKDLNASIYSHHSSVISSIKSQDTKKSSHKQKKITNEEEFDENLNQDFQATMDTIVCESNPKNYETDSNDKELLKKHELSIHIFTTRLLNILLDNTTRPSSILIELFETTKSLFSILAESKSEWSNLNTGDILANLFQKLNYNLTLWHYKEPTFFNRTVYIHQVNILISIINLMHSTNETSLVLPNDLSDNLFAIINDICLNESFQEYIDLLAPLLAHLDPKLYEIYLHSNKICDNLSAICEFLVGFDGLPVEDLLRLGQVAVDCLDLHVCKQLPHKIVELNAKQFEVDSLLKVCMTSVSDDVRMETFESLKNLVSSCIDIKVACDTKSNKCKKIEFLLTKQIFYELVSQSLFDSCLKVKENAKLILIQLLQCHMLVSREFYERLSTLVSLTMPFIQCEASQIDKLGQVVLQLSDDVRDLCESSMLSSNECLRASFRYLFHKEKNIRKIGYRQVVGYLYREQSSEDAGFFCNNLNEFYLKFSPDKFGDVLVKLTKPKIFNDTHESIYQMENLVKIYNIFSSETVEMDVKRGAGEQLSIMLSDRSLHKAFINLGGVEYCLKLIKNNILLSYCFTCLSNILFWNKEIRNDFIFETQFYKLLFKDLILNADNCVIVEDIGAILFTLLFHETSSIENYGDFNTSQLDSKNFTKINNHFKLNSNLIKYFKAPFEIFEIKCKLSERNAQFNNLFKTLNDTQKEILNRKFRIYWNIKWHNGVNNLIDDLLNNKQVNNHLHVDFNKNLILTSEDKQCVKSSSSYYLFKQLFESISKANSHQVAFESLDLIQINLLLQSKSVQNLNWIQCLQRFASILPKSETDQMLFSKTFQTISKIFKECPLDAQVDLNNLIDFGNYCVCNETSTFMSVFKSLFEKYEQDECKTNLNLCPLNNFIKEFYLKPNFKQTLPNELISFCLKHLRQCETDKFQNLNKLSCVLELFVHMFKNVQLNNFKIQLNLVKSFIQIINLFHVGRGGLSLSFMGNSIIKSSLICLFEIVNSVLNDENEQNKMDLIRHLIFVKEETSSSASTWLISHLLHREPQIRSISFAFASQLITHSYARKKFLTYQNGIWSIGLSVLLNRYESSIVRTQACCLLVNLTQALTNQDENTISLTALQILLQEHNFFNETAALFSSFYPFDTLDLDAIRAQSDASLSSPLLIACVCQLLYNLSVLLPDDILQSLNQNGIIRLLVGYVKSNLLTQQNNLSNEFYNLVEMLNKICKYLHLCCQCDRNYIIMLSKEINFVREAIGILRTGSDKNQMKSLYINLFDLMGILLNNDDSNISNEVSMSLFESFELINKFLVEILTDESIDIDLLENALKFYSIFMIKLTQIDRQPIYDEIVHVYDEHSLGNRISLLLIKKFDIYCLNDSSVKQHVYNSLKGLFTISPQAKNTATQEGFIEALIEHLKHTNSKLNLKALNSKSPLKDIPCLVDLRQILLTLKSLMYKGGQIKDELNKIGLHSIIHSFWCWAPQDPQLLQAILATLCIYTSHNKQGASLIAQSNIVPQSLNPNEQRGIPLLSLIIKVLLKSNKYPIQKYGFGLLINCAQVHECKNIIWKSNILQEFLSDLQLHRGQAKKEKLWFQFLTSLSFTLDGQAFFMKVDGLIVALIKCLDSPFTQEIHYYSLLILRNLAFNHGNKSKLLSNSEYIDAIMQSLQHSNGKFKILSLSCLDALLYENQKAKVVFKNANIKRYLSDLCDFYASKKDLKTINQLKSLIKTFVD